MLILPSMGILESYQGDTSEYYNAFGIYQLGKSYSYLKERTDRESDVHSLVHTKSLLFYCIFANVRACQTNTNL